MMNSFDPKRLMLQVRIALGRASWAAMITIMSLVFGITPWAWYGVNHAALAKQEDNIRQQRLQSSAQHNNTVRLAGLSSEQKLDNFYRTLGDRSRSEKYLAVIFSGASRSGLSLDQGEYQWQFDRDSNIYRYQIHLPVKGNYGEIRKFCQMVLLELPFASLNEMNFQRESASDDALDANLSFTLYLNGMPATQRYGT